MATTAQRVVALTGLALATLLAGQGCGGGGRGAVGAEDEPARLGLAGCDQRPDDCNSGRRRDGGALAIGLTGGLADFAPRSALPGAPGPAGVVGLLAPAPFTVLPSGAARYNADLLTGEPEVTATDPQTVVYRLRAQARWSDGAPISAEDFRYAWRLRTEATEACAGPDTAGYGSIASVSGSDNGKTVTVRFSAPQPDWRTLFAGLLPAHVAATAGDLTTADGVVASCGAWERSPEWSGGPYRVSAFDPGHQVELVANPAWYGADRPTLEKLVFRLFADRGTAVAALERGEVDGVELQPDLETATRVRRMSQAGIQAQLTASRDWVHLDLNTGTQALADRTLRDAIFTAVGSQEILAKAVRDHFPSAGPRLAHQLFPGQVGYRDVLAQVAPGQGSGDTGAALRALSAAGYTLDGDRLRNPAGETVPDLRLRLAADDDTLRVTAEVIRDQVRAIGLAVTVDPVDDLAGAVSGGDFDLVLRDSVDGAALAPAIARWRGGGPENPTGWSDADADALLDRAATELDQARQHTLLNRQDEIMTAAAVVLPLFQRPRLLAIPMGIVNIRASAAGGALTDSAAQWGISAEQ